MKTAGGLQIKGLTAPDNPDLLRRDALPTPTPPPKQPPDNASSVPPLKRPRLNSIGRSPRDYIPISALNMFYHNLNNSTTSEFNSSPYDLSQKSSSSSSVSQSDIPVTDRPNSASPPEEKPSMSQQPQSSSSPEQHQQTSSSTRAPTPLLNYQNKENSLDDTRGTLPSPSSVRTPQPTSSSSSSNATNCVDSQSSRDDSEAVAGPSGVRGTSDMKEEDTVRL